VADPHPASGRRIAMKRDAICLRVSPITNGMAGNPFAARKGVA